MPYEKIFVENRRDQSEFLNRIQSNIDSSIQDIEQKIQRLDDKIQNLNDRLNNLRDNTSALLGMNQQSISDLKRIPQGDILPKGVVLLGKHKIVSYGVEPVGITRLNVTTAGMPAFYNIARLNGLGIKGMIERHVVGGIARVLIKKSGYLSLTWEDEVQLHSTNVGTGGDGEFVWAITQYDGNGNDLRSWLGEHVISDPILSSASMMFPFSKTTGIIPVSVGDYFTFNFAFNVNQANKRLDFSLPADNPGLDERIELVFFPILN